jgi:hypothetical protein
MSKSALNPQIDLSALHCEFCVGSHWMKLLEYFHYSQFFSLKDWTWTTMLTLFISTSFWHKTCEKSVFWRKLIIVNIESNTIPKSLLLSLSGIWEKKCKAKDLFWRYIHSARDLVSQWNYFQHINWFHRRRTLQMLIPMSCIFRVLGT